MKSNEKNFIKRLQRQEEDALEFIVGTYLPLIKGVTYKVLAPLQNEGIAEECINDIFLSIWNNALKFKGDSTDFRKWICAIAKFKAIDYYRQAMKKVEFTSEYMEMNTEKSVEDELIMMENSAELIKLINKLDSIDREIFMMKYFLGISTEDICKQFDLTRTAFDNRIYRGKKKLSVQAANLTFGGNLI